jgi:hypothetical protein
MEPPTRDPRDREARWLLAVGLLAVSASLFLRVVHRGRYVAGWDLIAPTEGHFLLSTGFFWSALREVYYQNRHNFNPFSEYSVPFSLIPGYLGRLWHWQYWVHVLTFVSSRISQMATSRGDVGGRIS